MEIDRYLLRVEHGEGFEYQEFTDRVVDKLAYDGIELETKYGKPAPVERNDAVFRIRAVVALLNEIIKGSDMRNLRNQPPEEYDEIFELADAEQKPWN